MFPAERSFKLALAAWMALVASCLTSAAALKILPGHVKPIPAGLTASGQLAESNHLRLAIGVPLPNPAALDIFLGELYDSANPNYRHYLTPTEFTEHFGPSESDYETVIDFVRTNGLTIVGTHGNRLLLDVQGSVADIQRAFHLKLRTYHHPSESRDFFAPDTEPSIDALVPIADVSGLDNYSLPRPKSLRMSSVSAAAAPQTGSSPGGAYMGTDFRAAYLPGTTLTGAGQILGLVQFDGFYASDITAYQTAAGLPSVPIQTVLLDGFSGTPTTGSGSGNPEVSLDVEMAMSMAPGLSQIVVFEAGPSGIVNDVLSAMAANNQIKQLSCSWGWSGGPSTTTDAIFEQMASQGQSFFCASGDSDAFTASANSMNGVDNPSLANAPSSSPYITTVGGTTLTTSGPGGAWSAETVWNWGLHKGSYVGSSGGISSYYSIPSWQAGVNMSANGGSMSQRNIPDVAFTADNVYVLYGNGASGVFGGTSCAAPLWAGLAALANQQAAAGGKPALGFVNPALYAIGQSSAYSAAFHDITAGDNTWSSSPGQFYATVGYDLCTGWGTPMGQPLLNALVGTVNQLALLSPTSFTSTGPVGGPFSPNRLPLVLTNSGTGAVDWSIVSASPWLQVSATRGTLPAATTTQLNVTWNSQAGQLPPGTYSAVLLITNQAGGSFTVNFALLVGQTLVRNGGFETGDFTGWTLAGNTIYRGNVYNAVEGSSSGFAVAHSGKYGAFLGDTAVAGLSQTLSTVPGQMYLLSFWLDNPTSGAGQQFNLSWNSSGTANSTLVGITNPPAFGWTNLQFLVTATGTNTILRFSAANPPNYFGLDDVSVVPIPQPGFQTVTASAGGLQLSWFTATGLAYQVQYQTNLLQNQWSNLTAPFIATGFNWSFTDTNVAGAQQRFYRLVVAP